MRIIFVLSMGAFLMLGPFLMATLGMEMRADGQMGDCPFMPGVSVCPMTPLEHIVASTHFLTTLPRAELLTLLVILFIGALITLLPFWRRTIPPPRLNYAGTVADKTYIPLTHLLQRIFAHGILNPKLF